MHLRFILSVIAAFIAAASVHAYNFSISTLQGVSLTPATSLQFGPDNRLYVAQVNGQILALTVQRLGPNNYQVTATETINLVRDIPNYDDSGIRNFALTKRQVTGLLVVGTAANPIIYVTSSDPRIGGGSGGENDLNLDTNSGIISRLTRSGSVWSKVDIVRGLPRSEENHAPNGMQLDQITNTLYLAQGGNTNAGGPSINFAYMCETALSAAVLSIDLDALDAMPVKTDPYGQKYLYDLPTLDDPNPSRTHNPDGSDLHDPFGGNDGLNQARLVAGGPVQIHAPGFRNPYDLVLTRTPGHEGRLYTFDNGANLGWGGYPHNEGPAGNATNQYVEGEPGQLNNRDSLHLITGPGYYGGHPNPIRANPATAGWFHYDNTQPPGSQKIYSTTPTTDWPPVPLSMANPIEGDFHLPGSANGALLTYPESTNGLAEYVATNFNGEMQGNLIAASYDGTLLRIALNADGTEVTNGVEPLATGFGNLPLDVTAPDPGHGAPFLGTIWVAHYSPAKISILEPEDFDSPGSSTCTGINSFDVDEDGDGFSNADEILNDSDPCSGAIRPADVDGDNLSDLLDTDDDNDGIPDESDRFPLDPLNGRSVPLPINYNLFNETGIGFYGVGFTGLMMNPGEDYLDRISEDNVIAGGTAGLFTVAQVGAGSPRGASNSQMDAYHFAFNSDEFTAPYVVTSRLAGPFFDSAPTANQVHGVYIGHGDQDNYVSVAVHANNGTPALQVVYEVGGSIAFEQLYPVADLGTASTIDLSFTVDAVAGTVQPGYTLAGATDIVPLGSAIHVTDDVLVAIMGPDPLAIGLFANTGGGGAPTFSATWDFFDIALVPNTAIAKITIDPSGSNMVTSSTYNSGSFKIQNLSTGGQQIDSVLFDLSTSIFPDMVFDPAGTAGDTAFKGFTANSSTGGVDLGAGIPVAPHNGTNSADGYDGLDITFDAFPVNGQFTFSIDADPTNVKGVPPPGENEAASVSGLELLGTTVSVFFDDGSVHRARLGRVENSVDGSYGWARAVKPPKPGISVVGKTAPVQTGQPETVRVTGPAGLDVSLVIVEGALYLGGVPGGGYDIDPLEANTAIKVTELSGTISPEGFADFAVTPTKSDDEGGLNYITATLIDANDIKGPASDNLIIWYDPSFGGGDTQAPTAPGGLNASSITHRSVTLSWFASTDNVGVVAYDILRDGTLVSSVLGLNYTDIGLEDDESYIYSVVARDEAGNTSTATTLPVETTDRGTVVVRVNAGGPNFVDSKGNTWAADHGFNTGTTASTTSAIYRTIDDTLFKTRRVDSAAAAPDLIYSFNVPNGSYEVQLFLSENDPPNSAAGKRVFDISIEGQLAFDNFDTFASAGTPYTAVVLAATTTVIDGQLNLAFGRVTGNPQIGAIKIIALPSDETEPPTAPGTLTFTNVTSSTVTVNWTASTDNVAVVGYRVSRDGVLIDTVTTTSFNDSGLAPESSYDYSVVAVDSAGNVSPASTGTITTDAGGGTPFTPIRINAGGALYTDPNGITWAADTGYNTGNVYTTTASTTGTTSPNLFKSERWDPPTGSELVYTFSVPNGSYLVRLHFSEVVNSVKGAGLRVFDIDLENQRVFEDVDIFTLAGGGNQAIVLEQTVTVADGQLQIAFTRQVENPKINAIEILASDAPGDTQPPIAPASLAASAITATSLTLNWTAATDNIGVTGYRVSRNGQLLDTVTATTFADDGLSPNTEYTYSVVAIDAAGNASPSATVNVTTFSAADTQPPTAPGALSFTNVTASSLTVSWPAATDNVGVTGYHVSRNGTLIGTVTTTSFADSGLTPATSYAYSIVAIDAAGNASSASSASISTSSGGSTFTPIRINAGGPLYTDPNGITWSADTGYNTGNAYSTTANTSGTTSPNLFKTERWDPATGSELTYTFNVPNGSYLVRLHFSEVYADTKGAGLRVFDIDLENQRVFEDVDIFTLAGGGNIALVLESTVVVTDGALQIGFVHQVENPKINAIEILAASPPGDTQSPTTPGSPTFTNVTSSSVTVNWTASTDNVGVTGYRVSRNGTLIDTVTGTSFADSGLSPATSYTYAIVAIDAAGNVSPASSATVATTNGGGSPFTPIRVNAGGPQYVDTLGNIWSADTGFNSGTTVTTAGTVAGTPEQQLYKQTRYDVAGAPDLIYTFAVPNGDYIVRLHFMDASSVTAPNQRIFDVDIENQRAFDDVDIFAQAGGNLTALALETTTTVADGELQIHFLRQKSNPRLSAIEILAANTPGDTQPPTTPGSPTFTNVTSNNVTVNWSASTDNVGVTGYRVSRNGTLIDTVTGTSFADSGLSPATSYTYAIVAIDAVGNVSPASSATVATTSGGGSPFTPIRVNAGGPQYVDTLGNTWSADTGFNSGTTVTTAGTVAGTPEQQLYKQTRYDVAGAPDLIYTFAVPNGDYLVRLHFMDASSVTAPNQRIFDVDIENQRAFDDIDIFAQAGGNLTALALETSTTVADGELQIHFLRQKSNPRLSAIEILAAP